MVKRIPTENENWVSEKQEIVKVVMDHIRGVFEVSRGNKNAGFHWDSHMNHVSGNLSAASLNILMEPFSRLEVKGALFQMYPTKAPGPDDFLAIFFQRFWNLVGSEVTRLTLKMLNESKLEEGINDTII